MLNSVKKEATPERLYSLIKIIEEKSPISKNELSSIIVPTTLNKSKTTNFGSIIEGVLELNMATINENNEVVFCGDSATVKTMDSFRRYCNSLLFVNHSTAFYKTFSCILSSDDRWFQYGSVTTSAEINRYIYEETGLQSLKLEKDIILGVRFWFGFLGMGFFNENTMTFLPNMYTALKDFMILGSIEKGKEYSVEEFLDNLHSSSAVALKNARESLTLNLAMSNALRLLHDNKEIELKKHLDSEKIWHLFPNEEHEFTSDITHIIIKKAVK